MIGHETSGSGPITVLVLHDWIGDTSTWDGARAYLDGARFTWVFASLRGYGRSRGQAGEFTVREAAADVVALADSLGLARFALVGHSMSTLIAVHLAQHHPDRIERVVLVTPPPPAGFGADAGRIAYLQGMAHGDDATRTAGFRAMGGGRLSEGWLAFKVARWRATADPQAIAGYALMFARDGVPDPAARITMPALAITCEQDAEIMRREAVTRILGPLCAQLTVASFADSGHYPMQEAPPLFVATVERFLGDGAKGVTA